MKFNLRWALVFWLLLSLAVAVTGSRTSPMMATVAAAAPARKALAIQSSLVYQTYNWEHYPDDTMSREPTEVQQPQLDDAWKHLQDIKEPSVKNMMLCDELNPDLCPLSDRR